MGVPIGISGTLVGTALETLGYYYQSYLLDTLGGILSGPVATLCFVIGAMVALTRLVLTGKPGMIVWLLVGPTLFYAVIGSRTQTFGSEWKFGRNARNQTQVSYEVQNYMQQPDVIENAAVSSLFAQYNKLVSSIVSQVVAVIVSAKEDIDARFLLRTELAAVVRSTEVEDQGLRLLLHENFFRNCGQMIDFAEQIRDPHYPEATRQEVQKQFLVAEKRTAVVDSLAKDYVATVLAKYPGLDSVVFQSTTREVAEWLHANSASMGSGPVDVAGFERRKLAAIDDIENGRQNLLTCGQVWNLVYTGLYQTAKSVADEALQQGKSIPESDLIQDLLMIRQGDLGSFPNLSQSGKAEQLHVLVRVISAYLLRNEMKKQSGAAFVNSFAKRGFEFAALTVPSESDLSHLERIRLRSTEWDYRTRIVTVATNLPYYQGLALYFLSILFIFFATLLLIPGRQNGFFLWFILWLWVKSWDIGFAIVMLLDDILYSLFTYWHGAKDVMDATGLGISADLPTTWYALRHLDPSFQLTTYYSIIAGALGAVPIVSSYLILSSLKGGSSLITDGVSRLAAGFGSHARTGGGAQTAINQLKLSAYDEEIERAQANVDAYKNGTEQPPSRSALAQSNLGTGRSQGASANQLTEDLKHKAALAGAAAGAAAGTGGAGYAVGNLFQRAVRMGPGVSSAIRNSLTIIGGGIQTWGTFEKALRKAGMDREAGLLNAHLDIASQQAPLATFNDEKVLKWSAQARALGQLEVPWADREGAWDAEVRKEVFDITSQRIFDAAHYRSWEDALGKFSLSVAGLVNMGVAWAAEVEHEAKLGGRRIEDTIVRPPLEGGRLGRGWQDANGLPGHFGQEIEISAPGKESVTPTNEGLLIFKGKYGDFGTVAIVAHRNNTFTIYANLKENDGLSVREGEWVTTSSVIGVATSSSHSTPVSFHFAIVDSGFRWVDPRPLMDDKLPLNSAAVEESFKQFLIAQRAKFNPEPRPFPDQ